VDIYLLNFISLEKNWYAQNVYWKKIPLVNQPLNTLLHGMVKQTGIIRQYHKDKMKTPIEKLTDKIKKQTEKMKTRIAEIKEVLESDNPILWLDEKTNLERKNALNERLKP